MPSALHPGKILEGNFLKQYNIEPRELAYELRVPYSRISEVLAGKRSITIDTACRLARFFGTEPRYWIDLQSEFSLSRYLETKNQSLMLISRHQLDDN